MPRRLCNGYIYIYIYIHIYIYVFNTTWSDCHLYSLMASHLCTHTPKLRHVALHAFFWSPFFHRLQLTILCQPITKNVPQRPDPQNQQEFLRPPLPIVDGPHTCTRQHIGRRTAVRAIWHYCWWLLEPHQLQGLGEYDHDTHDTHNP